MKKTVLIVVLASVLALISGAKAVQFDYRDFEGLPYAPPIVTLVSPSINETYSVPNVPLNVTVQIRGFIYANLERIRWLNYSLDGQTAVNLTLTVPSSSDIHELPYSVYGNQILTGLSDGTHNLTIYGETFIGGMTCYFNETVSFKIDTSSTPKTEPIPASVIFVTSIGIVVVATGLFVYLKKRKS